jgi:hypothetical protein
VKKLFRVTAQVAMLLLFVGVPMAPREADAWQFLACYKWVGVDPPTVFDAFNRYKLATASPEVAITEPAEETIFHHPHQIALSIVGKHVGVCGETTVRPVGGTLISTVPLNAGIDGARLGLETYSSDVACSDLEISCKATDLTAFPPPAWACIGRNVAAAAVFTFNLVQVVETTDANCSLWEDPLTLPNLVGPGGRSR